jgi:protein-disulfide isomerase
MRMLLRVVVPSVAAASLLVLAGCGGAAVGSGSQSGGSGSVLPDTVDSEVLGVLNGEEITLDDLTDRDISQLAQLRTDYYTETHALLEQGAVRAAREQLLLAAAAEKGMTLNQFYTNEIGIPEVSDEELQYIYDQNRGQFGGRSLDEIGTQLRRQIANQKLAQMIEATGSQFLREAEWDLTVPAYRVAIETADHATLGPDSAPVELVIFSCFECPFCRRFDGAIHQLREDETLASQVKLVFRHFPLRNMHPMAQKAHEAAVCAEDQGQFWEFHDALWADENISLDGLEQHARLLGLDTEEFAQCLNSGSSYERVQTDLDAALALGQTGTPAVFANGRYIGGAISFEQLVAEIEREIAESN